MDKKSSNKESLVKILSYVDIQESMKYQQQIRRRRLVKVFAKFKEHVITLETKWRIENSDFSCLMNEFKTFDEFKTKNKKAHSDEEPDLEEEYFEARISKYDF